MYIKTCFRPFTSLREIHTNTDRKLLIHQQLSCDSVMRKTKNSKLGILLGLWGLIAV